jgi:hypothetical protein
VHRHPPQLRKSCTPARYTDELMVCRSAPPTGAAAAAAAAAGACTWAMCGSDCGMRSGEWFRRSPVHRRVGLRAGGMGVRTRGARVQVQWGGGDGDGGVSGEGARVGWLGGAGRRWEAESGCGVGGTEEVRRRWVGRMEKSSGSSAQGGWCRSGGEEGADMQQVGVSSP